MLVAPLPLIVALLAAGPLALAALLLYSAIRHQLAYLNFKRASRGLPILGDRKLLGNHAISWAVRKNVCQELLRVHLKAGARRNTIGLLHNEQFAISTLDLDLIKVVALDESDRHTDRLELGLPMREFAHSWMLARGLEWSRARRAFAPALKSNKFQSEENVRRELELCASKLIDSIDRKLDEQAAGASRRPFNVSELMHKYSLNLIFSCFYKEYELINFHTDDDDDADADDKHERAARECNWLELMERAHRSVQSHWLVHAAILLPALRPAIDWLHYNFEPAGAWRRRLIGYARQVVRLGAEARARQLELRAQGKRLDGRQLRLADGRLFKRNLIDCALDQLLEGRLTEAEYLNSASSMLLAGDKTITDALIHTLYQLAVDAQVQARLRAAVQLEGAQAKYLGWVVSESLRLLPPVSLGCSRVVTRDMPLEGGRHLLPKNTFVLTPAFVIHRLPEYWGPDADQFRPERWRDTTGHHPMQYMPFGAGARACPGREFALHNIRTLLVALLTRYTFECAKKVDLYVYDSPFLIFVIENSPTLMTIKRLPVARQRGQEPERQ